LKPVRRGALLGSVEVVALCNLMNLCLQIPVSQLREASRLANRSATYHLLQQYVSVSARASAAGSHWFILRFRTVAFGLTIFLFISRNKQPIFPLCRHGSCRSWINARLADKTVWSLDNVCHTWALLPWGCLIKWRYIKCPLPLPLPSLWNQLRFSDANLWIISPHHLHPISHTPAQNLIHRFSHHLSPIFSPTHVLKHAFSSGLFLRNFLSFPPTNWSFGIQSIGWFGRLKTVKWGRLSSSFWCSQVHTSCLSLHLIRRSAN